MRWLIACLSCLLASSALAAPLCVEGSPPVPPAGGPVLAVGSGDGGIGGTGHAPGGARPEEGIGGTGRDGSSVDRIGLPLASGEGIGVVGVITGFASICVNGLEVHIDAATPVSENGRAAQTGSLAVGQFVSIDAVLTSGGLRARDVAIVHLIEGPVSARPDGGFAVMGEPIELLPNARLPDGGKLPAAGSMVKVSGMRTPEGRIRATRIAPAPELADASVIGDVTLRAGDSVRIEGLQLSGDRSVLPESVPRGQVMAKGRWNGESLVTSAVAPDPTLRFARHTSKLVLEALVSGTLHEGDMMACGLSVKGSRDTLLKGVSGTSRLEARRVRISGRLDAQGAFDAEYIDADLPPGLDPVPSSVGQGVESGAGEDVPRS